VLTNKRRLLVLSLAFLLGVVVGVVPSAALGFRQGTNRIVDNWVVTNARNSTDVMAVLRLLRNRQTEEGIENLETHLNRLLIGLTPSYLEGFELRGATLSHVQKTRDSARNYRTEYPRPQSQKLLDREIAEFLGTADSARR
jgi:hypothetical protein